MRRTRKARGNGKLIAVAGANARWLLFILAKGGCGYRKCRRSGMFDDVPESDRG